MSIITEMHDRGWTFKAEGSWERVEADRMCVALIRADKTMTIMVQGNAGWAGIGRVKAGLSAKATAKQATTMALR